MQDFTKQLNDTLLFYKNEIEEKVKDQIKKSAEELVKETKRTSPVGRRKRHYRDNIKQKEINSALDKPKRLWYVGGSDYRLSHLLNNDHAKRGGQGSVHGTKFITKANDKVQRELEEAVKEIISDTK